MIEIALHATAQRWQCGAYDGIDLDLAQRMRLALATRDRGLVTAARAAGVPTYEN
jgi:predicted nucleic acid-binding protein